MSTLTVSNIKKTGETASRDVSGVAAAWANLNGTGTIEERDSLNISNVEDEGTGQYKFHYSNNMGNGGYSVSWSAANSAGSSATAFFISGPNGNTLQVDSTFCNIRNSSTLTDRDQVFFLAHGDLA